MNVPKFRPDDRIVNIPKNDFATVVSGPDRTQHGDMYYVHQDSDPDVLKQIYDDYWVLADSPLIFTKGENVIYVNPITKEETQGTVDGPAFDVGGMRGDVIVKGSMPVPEPLYFITISVPVDYVAKTSGRKIVNSNHLKKIVKVSPLPLHTSVTVTGSPSITGSKSLQGSQNPQIAPSPKVKSSPEPTVAKSPHIVSSQSAHTTSPAVTKFLKNGKVVLQVTELPVEDGIHLTKVLRESREAHRKKTFMPNDKFTTEDGREGVVVRKAQYNEFGLELSPTIDHYVVQMIKGDADIVKDAEQTLMIGHNMRQIKTQDAAKLPSSLPSSLKARQSPSLGPVSGRSKSRLENSVLGFDEHGSFDKLDELTKRELPQVSDVRSI